MNDDLLRSVVRHVVRHDLADLIRPEVGTEDQIVTMFLRCLQARPDVRMGDAATAFRLTIQDYLERRHPAITIRTVERSG